MATAITPANGIEICYETLGDPSGRPLVLISGLSMQLVAWPAGFCEALVDQGFYVVRFDNRDVGCSTHCHEAPRPDLAAALSGDVSSASYTIRDMAADTAALMDHLGFESAHVLGVSMGGMIAQELAIGMPGRVRSLTSVMSTPHSGVGPPSAKGQQALAARRAANRDEAIEQAVTSQRLLASPGYPFDEEHQRAVAATAYDRGYDPRGIARQFLAIVASPDRRPGLRELRIPTLVVHGADDPLIGLAGGRATAEAVPGAELVVIPGMGHDLPRPVWEAIVKSVADLADRAEEASGS